jgi:hypothetical protein
MILVSAVCRPAGHKILKHVTQTRNPAVEVAIITDETIENSRLYFKERYIDEVKRTTVY